MSPGFAKKGIGMELNDKIIVITGAASGIGRAMALRFAAEKPQKIICTDIDPIGAQATASDVGGGCDSG